MRRSRAGAKAVRVSPEISGRPDGVEVITSCVLSRFRVDHHGKLTELKEFPERHEGKLLASRSNGTVSLSVQGAGEMVTVQLEDLANLLREADCASITESQR